MSVVPFKSASQMQAEKELRLSIKQERKALFGSCGCPDCCKVNDELRRAGVEDSLKGVFDYLTEQERKGFL